MSESSVAIPPISREDIFTHFGFKEDSLPPDMLKPFAEMQGILFANAIDRETALGIVKSFESRFGQAEDSSIRVNKFLNFLKGFEHNRDNLLGAIKSMGLYSKAELEEYARETGDWGFFLRRLERDKRDSYAHAARSAKAIC